MFSFKNTFLQLHLLYSQLLNIFLLSPDPALASYIPSPPPPANQEVLIKS